MAVLQVGNSPGQRISAGDTLVAAAKKVNVAPVRRRFNAFVKAHRSYSQADSAVARMTKALHEAEAAVARADVEQDAAVETLAARLAGDGLPRSNPFKPFGVAAPNTVEKVAMEAEAKLVHKLTAAVLKRKGLSKQTLGAARDLDAKARAVEKLLARLPPLQKAQAKAIAVRSAVGRPWESEFARLKRAVRAADDDGAGGLFAALFEVEKKPAKKSKAAKQKTSSASGGGNSGSAPPTTGAAGSAPPPTAPIEG